MQQHIKRKKKPTFKRYGIVLSIQDGIVLASGLKTVGLTEVVSIKKKVKGLVSTLERDYVRICLMGSERDIQPGDIISRTRKFITVPVGFSLLGRVVNSLGKPIDGKGSLRQTNIRKFNFRRLKNAFKIYALRRNLTTLTYIKRKATTNNVIKTEAKKAKKKKNYNEIL